jgi:hypothetical protein
MSESLRINDRVIDADYVRPEAQMIDKKRMAFFTPMSF